MGRLLTYSVILLVAALTSCAEGADEPLAAWTRRPYRLRVAVGTSLDAGVSAGFRRAMMSDVEAGCRRIYGPACDVAVVDSEDEPRSLAALKRLDEAELAKFPAEFDQRLFVVLEASLGGAVACARSWTAADRKLSGVVKAETLDRRLLADLVIDLVGRLFSPVLEVIDVADERVTLSLRAGEFESADPDRPQVKPGDVLKPFIRYLDKQGDVKQIQPLPWTYLVVESAEGAVVQARLATGVRSPIGSKRRRGIEVLAVSVPATEPATVLTLVPRGDRLHPLVAHPVLVGPRGDEAAAVEKDNEGKEKEKDPPIEEPLRLLSDRSGRITVARDDRPLVWLRIFSGEQMLARVPFVSGSVAAATLELPDDSLRLTVEGELELLKGRLVEAVARRATLVGRIRALAKSGDWKSVAEMQRELAALPGVKQFEQQVNAIRAPALETATRRKDKLTEARVRQLSGDAEQLIRRYLDSEKLRELQEELDELKSLDAKDAGGKKE